MPVTSRRTKISDDWQPLPDDVAYADAHGIADLPAVVEHFRDYHLSRGSLMADWRAAWRTWCRNQVRFGQAVKPKAPLLPPEDVEADPWGCMAYARQCKFAKPGTIEGGKVVPCVEGWDLPGVLSEVCEAVGLPREWRGDLAPIAIWLRDGFEPEHILDVVRAHKPPRELGGWWAYERAVRRVKLPQRRIAGG